MAPVNIMQMRSAGEAKPDRFDYRGKHRYYLTLTTFHDRPVFTDAGRVRTVLDALRDASLTGAFEVYAYVFVPGQLVMLVRGANDNSDLKVFLSGFRAAASAALAQELGHPLWRRTYQERVLRKTEDSRETGMDLIKLPVRMGLCPTPEAYPHWGSFVLPQDKLLKMKWGGKPQYEKRGGGRGGERVKGGKARRGKRFGQ
jgi:putative transposase